MSIIEKIYRDREDLSRVLKKHRGIRKIVEDLYPDSAHFIYELLQNAEDTTASEVSFMLSENRLVFEHNGRPFDESDIRAITDIGEGTSAANDDKIGRFGIGFKAVFSYTETPRIWSPTFAFEISDMVLPSKMALNPSLGNQTRFEFPFNSDKKSESETFSEVQNGLKEISEATLLFLSHVESIQWQIGTSLEGRLLRIPQSDQHIETLREVNGRATGSRHFLRFTKPIEQLENRYAAVAFELEALPTVNMFDLAEPMAKQFRIVPATPGQVAVFFTAKKESSGLRFHLHAPFVPEVSRASIKDTPANEPLFRQLAELTAHSLFSIRDLGLLNAAFLAVLPNPNDEIPSRFECIRDAVVTAMNERQLTPTHLGKHAPAKHLLQAKSSLKGLLDQRDIKVLSNFNEGPLDWAVGATQRNSAVDRFLRGLDIQEWDVEDFVEVLDERLDSGTRFDIRTFEHLDGPDEELIDWLSSKSDEWHQKLYSLLYRELDERDCKKVDNLYVVRLASGEYGVGKECYFPTGEVQHDPNLPRVARATYTSGRNESEKDSARKLLEAIGVRKVGEREQIHSILKQRYSKDADVPSWELYRSDLIRFIDFVKDDPKAVILFKDYRIFERTDSKWGKPHQVYLDTPYCDTGLHAFFTLLEDKGDNSIPVALMERYLEPGIPPKGLVAFAKAVGAHTKLGIVRQSTSDHSERELLRQDGVWETNTTIDDDWVIPNLALVMKHPSEALSKLIWNTMEDAHNRFLTARFRRNQQYETRENPSTLVLTLRKLEWVPQEDGNFVRPAAASQDLLPEGFPFDHGSLWIKSVGFGEESAKRVEERRRNQETANRLGFKDEEELDRARRFTSFSAEIQRRILAENERRVDMPDHQARDPHRRTEEVRRHAKNAPRRSTKSRPRSVSEHRDAVKDDAKSYLMSQYTNVDRVMICQVCRKALPFKLADENYYFEAVEFLPDLQRHHYQNYLTLCPNHAAMYMYANGSVETMKEIFLGLDGNELEIALAGENETIYFTRMHIADLRTIIEAEALEQKR